MFYSKWKLIGVLFSNLVLAAVDGFNASRTCVIGAGYTGLGTARYLHQHGLNFTVLEATKYLGGQWHFDPHVDVDEDGVPLFTSMYKNLRTNTPRQTMEYEGFPFPEGTPSYPTATCFHKYLTWFAQKFDIEKYIQYRSYVNLIERVEDHWRVTYTKTDTKETIKEDCDYVVVATGELAKPVLPKFPGLELFKGKKIHSHDYKDPAAYKGKRLLLVGAGPSGMDLATHLANVTAKLYHSHHTKYNQPYFGVSYVKKPDIRAFTTNGVEFVDGSFEEVDEIIFCTGYDMNLPFLDKSCGITKSGKYVLPLYQQMVNIRYPSMIIVGSTKKIINRVLAAQGEYAAALIAKKFQLPSQEKMLRSWFDHVHSLNKKGYKLTDINIVGPEMDTYFGNLTAEAGISRAAPVLTTIRDFNAVYRLEDLLNYRDYDFQILDDTHYKWWFNPRKELPCPINIE